MARDIEAAKGPPVTARGPLGWMRANLFGSLGDTVLTLVAMALLVSLLIPIIDWAIVKATWTGETRSDCVSGGACWVFVKARIGQFVYGFYPDAERWRVDTSALLLIGLIAWLVWPDARERNSLLCFR